MPFERVMEPNRHNLETYGDVQPVARSMKPSLWVPSKDLSFGLLPKLGQQQSLRSLLDSSLFL